MRSLFVPLIVVSLLLVVGCGSEGNAPSAEECQVACQEMCGELNGCQCPGCAEGLTCNENNRCQTADGCIPTCAGAQCGSDGCGGTCGDCNSGFVCEEGSCVEGCIPVCGDAVCGEDGCGGECGQCQEGEECSEGMCLPVCVPDCDGKECGDDGCDGTCGECSGNGECVEGACLCEGSCEGKECGDDGCGESCGECPEDSLCSDDGVCVCQPDCNGKECGPDGCGSNCGVCEVSAVCEAGQCKCVPDCLEKVCGDDGCGGECGECPVYHTCTADGTCICIPDCEDKECGSDGCGGLCAVCGCGEQCQSYQCIFIACEERECGSDGCGGSCGSCGQQAACVGGSCPEPGVQCFDDNDVEWDGCTGSQVTEFLVNDNTSGNQELPDVIALSTGDYVVAYQDSEGDSGSYGIRLRWFPGDGSLASPSVLANTFQNASQTEPCIARLTNGSFVVVWQSSGQDGWMSGIYGQRYTAQGVKAGAEFQCNSYTDYAQENSTVSGLPSGGFTVLWESSGQDGSGKGIYAKDFDAEGTAVSPEHRINSYTIADQGMPALTGLSSGGHLATWGSFSQDNDGWGIFAQMFDGTGQPVGLEFQVNTTTYSYQSYPQATTLGTGGFVIVWQSQAQDGEGLGVVGQRFGAMGPTGSEFLLNQTTAMDQRNVDIAHRPGGGFVAVWESDSVDTGYDIVARLYDATGTPEGNEMVVNKYLTGEQTYPKVDVFEDGSFVVVWSSSGQDGSNRGVYARRFTPTGELIWR